MVLGGGAPAAAHEVNPGVRVEIDALPAELGDLDISVATSVADQLVLANPTDDVVEVLDDEGTPFLRIGRGIVEANTSSAGWYLTNNPFGLSTLPENLPATPQWRTVSAEPSWGWFDHRLHPTTTAPPPELVASGRSGLLARWTVPIRFRGADVDITGSVFFRPIRGSVTAELREPPAVDGVELGVLQGRVPGLFLDNTGAQRVTVLGAQGEPFLRFDRNGVKANIHSPSWLAAQRAEGGSLQGVVVDADRAPRWRAVSEVPRFGWIDPRLAVAEEDVPVDVAEGGVTRTLQEWRIPLRADGAEVAATGVSTWRPARNTPVIGPAEEGGTPPWRIVGFVALVAVVAGVPWIRKGVDRLVASRSGTRTAR